MSRTPSTAERLDGLPVTSPHLTAVALCAIGLLLDVATATAWAANRLGAVETPRIPPEFVETPCVAAT